MLLGKSFFSRFANPLDQFPALLLSLILAVTVVPYSNAQDNDDDDDGSQSLPTLTSEGVSNDMDSKERSPVLTVRPVVSPGNVKILVDAHVKNPEYRHLPIRFDFFVNRHFFTSQIRSVELPGPIGIDIGSTTATPPFNYTVIARVVHPNREFTTVINGAVFSSSLASTLDCTLTTGINGEESVEYVANDVTTIQDGDSSFGIVIEEESVDGGHDIVFSAAISANGDTATADFTYTQDGESQATAVAEGDIDISDGDLQSVSLTSSDGNVTLSCS